MWPSDCCWPPWNKFLQVTAMSARASGKSLEKYYLYSRGKVLWLFLVYCFCDPDAQLLQSFGALVGIDPGHVFLEYADEWQLSGYHSTGLPWPGFSEKS